MIRNHKIGQISILSAMGYLSENEKQRLSTMGYFIISGSVGTMNAEKVFAAIETAAKRESLIDNSYREEHALYHASLEAFTGVCRGQLSLGSILRTVGLSFSVVKGIRKPQDEKDGMWLAVALYGTIGAPVKGFEHEVIGLGISHL